MTDDGRILAHSWPLLYFVYIFCLLRRRYCVSVIRTFSRCSWVVTVSSVCSTRLCFVLYRSCQLFQVFLHDLSLSSSLYHILSFLFSVLSSLRNVLGSFSVSCVSWRHHQATWNETHFPDGQRRYISPWTRLSPCRSGSPGLETSRHSDRYSCQNVLDVLRTCGTRLTLNIVFHDDNRYTFRSFLCFEVLIQMNICITLYAL